MRPPTTQRQTGAKAVAAERKYPRAMKALTLAYHQDEKGKDLKIDGEKVPATVLTLRVAPFDKTMVIIDRQLDEHRVPIKEGELDWSTGSVTVGMQFFDPEGNCVAITHLSHDKQLSHDWTNCNYREGRIKYFASAARTPNAYAPRYNPLAQKPAAIIALWQAMADSPDATWLDGRAPTQEEVTAQTAEREEAQKNRQRGRTTETPDATRQLEPAHIDDEGETFDDVDEA
jgi:hypothetical protein